MTGYVTWRSALGQSKPTRRWKKGSDRLLRHCPRSAPGQKATGTTSLTVGGHKAGYVTWQSALGHKVIGAASLTVGGHMTGYVTWQSALGQKATGTTSLTVGGHKTGYVMWQSALGHKATGMLVGDAISEL